MLKHETTTERGFIDPISLAAIAFVLFIGVMAVGIAVDQWMQDEPQPTQEPVQP